MPLAALTLVVQFSLLDFHICIVSSDFIALSPFIFCWLILTPLLTSKQVLCLKSHYGHSVQFSHSVVSNSLQPHGLQHTRLPSITNSWSLLKLMSIKSVMPSNHLILCRPLLPSIFPNIRVFANESVLHIRWPKYWSYDDTALQ